MPFVGGVYRVPIQITSGVWVAVLNDIAAAINSLEAQIVFVETDVSNVAASAHSYLVNGTLATSVSSNALTISLKTIAGADPSSTDIVRAIFRDVTAATADYTTVQVTAATSLTISNGSTLGTTNNTAFKLWVVGFNDGGTFRIGVVNCLSGANIYPLAAFGIASSTAEGGGGGATSAQVFYTNAAVSSKAYSVLGYLTWESGLATAGAWSATQTRGQLFGPDVRLPGVEVQFVYSQSGTSATGATTVPFDNTIPQVTEGNQFQSQSFTPSSAANLLGVESQVAIASNANGQMSSSLFRDGAANALATGTSAEQDGGGNMRQIRIEYYQLSGTNSSTTYTVRAGLNNAATITFNGSGGSQIYGGVANSYIKITEYTT